MYCHNCGAQIENNVNQCPHCAAQIRRQEQIPAVDQTYYGIKGWLLFFCLILTVISPVVSSYFLFTNFAAVEPAFSMYPSLATICYLDLVLSIGLILFCIITGVMLWTKKPNAPKLVKILLFTQLIYSIVVGLLPFTAGLPDGANEIMIGEYIKNVARSGIFFGVWFSFITKSKRVNATFYAGSAASGKKSGKENEMDFLNKG